MIVPIDLFVFFHPVDQVSVNLQNIPNKEMNIKELEQVNGGNDNRQIDMPCVPNPRPIYEYEVYCLNNKVSNGVVKADTTYIRNLYQELSREHRI